jgi:hypothetical protein
MFIGNNELTDFWGNKWIGLLSILLPRHKHSLPVINDLGVLRSQTASKLSKSLAMDLEIFDGID